MSFLDERKALTREKRLSALSHFHGTLEGLIDETSGAEIKQRVRTFSQIHVDETINAFDVLSKIEDAAIIVNGSVGCGNIGLVNASENFNWYSTNLACLIFAYVILIYFCFFIIIYSISICNN